VESLDVLDLVPLKERCQCEKTYSTGVFSAGKLPNVLRVFKKKKRKNIENGDDDDDDDYEEKNGLSRSDGEGFEGSSETDDGESTIGKNGTTNDDSLSRAPANANENGGERILVNKRPRRSSPARTESLIPLKFKTVDLKKTKFDHLMDNVEWQEHMKKIGYGKSHKVMKIMLRHLTLVAFGLGLAFIFQVLENKEREKEEKLSATDVIYFVGTVMTTIGYGNVTPVTNGGKLLITCTCLPLIAKFAYSLSSLTEPLLQIARYVSFYTLKVLKIEEPLNLDVNVTQMMKTLAIQTTADYGTIDLSVNIPVKDLPTFLSVLSDGWENVRIRDVNKYVDELAGENFAEVASISVAETVTLLNLIKAKHTVMSEKLNMFAAFFMSCVVFWLGFAFFASVEKDRLSAVDSFYFSVITLSTVGFGDFVPQNTKQIAFWYAWVILGCGIFGTMIGSFSNIVNARQDEHVAKKALSKTFRNKDKLRKAKISLNEGSTALVRNNSYLKFEIKERYIAFTKLIGL